MRLTRAEIRNFRSIETLHFSFEPKCRVLVGINESGKSNILRALSLLDPEVKITAGDLREIRPNEKPYDQAYVRFVFTVDSDDKIRVLKSIASRIAGDFRKHPIIQIGGQRHTVESFINTRTETLYQVKLAEKKRSYSYWAVNGNAKILPPWQWVSGPRTDADQKKPTIINPKEVHAVGYQLKDFAVEDLLHLVAAEFNKVLSEKMPTVIFWRYSEDQLLPGQINTSAFAADPDVCVPLKHMFYLAGYRDVSATITDASKRPNGMRNLLKRVSQRSTQHLHQVWKEYREIDLEVIQNGDRIDAHVIDRYNTYDLARRSDGFKRFVAFLLHISAKVRSNNLTNTLYLDDEPDAGLHPSGARYLRDELVKVSANNHVVYATHSIFMIDGDNLGRHLIVAKRNEVTTAEQANESNFSNEEVLFNALGYSLFEQLRLVNLVFEGWRDKQLFEVALKSRSPNHKAIAESFSNVGRCYARGVRDVGRITAMLELARRKCLILTDADPPAREQQRIYKGFGEWLRYDQVLAGCDAITGEDFVKGDSFKKVLDEIRSEQPNSATLSPWQFGKGSGKLSTIMRWLTEAGLESDGIKAVLDRIREGVFANLKPEDIEESYFALLAGLAARLPTAN